MTINAPATGDTYESFRSNAMQSNETSAGGSSSMPNASTSIDVYTKPAQTTELPSVAGRVHSEYKAGLLALVLCLVLIF